MANPLISPRTVYARRDPKLPLTLCDASVNVLGGGRVRWKITYAKPDVTIQMEDPEGGAVMCIKMSTFKQLLSDINSRIEENNV